MALSSEFSSELSLNMSGDPVFEASLVTVGVEDVGDPLIVFPRYNLKGESLSLVL